MSKQAIKFENMFADPVDAEMWSMDQDKGTLRSLQIPMFFPKGYDYPTTPSMLAELKDNRMFGIKLFLVNYLEFKRITKNVNVAFFIALMRKIAVEEGLPLAHIPFHEDDDLPPVPQLIDIPDRDCQKYMMEYLCEDICFDFDNMEYYTQMIDWINYVYLNVTYKYDNELTSLYDIMHINMFPSDIDAKMSKFVPLIVYTTLLPFSRHEIYLRAMHRFRTDQVTPYLKKSYLVKLAKRLSEENVEKPLTIIDNHIQLQKAESDSDDDFPVITKEDLAADIPNLSVEVHSTCIKVFDDGMISMKIRINPNVEVIPISPQTVDHDELESALTDKEHFHQLLRERCMSNRKSKHKRLYIKPNEKLHIRHNGIEIGYYDYTTKRFWQTPNYRTLEFVAKYSKYLALKELYKEDPDEDIKYALWKHVLNEPPEVLLNALPRL